MSLRKRMLGVAGLGAISYVALAAPAGAAPAETVTPPAGGYYDHANLNVQGTGFPAETTIAIEECAAPGGAPPADPTVAGACDGNTLDTSSTTDTNGAFTDPNYLLFKLPSGALGESTGDLPQCDSTHECVLYIGTDQTNPSAPHVYSSDSNSNQFGNAPNGGFFVEDAPGQVPEAPYAIILPSAALGLLGGGYLALRRRHRPASVSAQ